jgi:hypothetical protein
MPSIDFPDINVASGSIFTSGDKTWEFNGVSWELVMSVEQIGTASIADEKLAANSVTTSKIANAAVTTAKIGTGAVGESNIANDAITSSKIANNAVGSSEIAAESVTTGKLANESVTESKLATSAVTTDKLNAGSVVEAKIGAGAVTNSKLADGSVGTTKIANSAITTDKIDANAVALGTQTTGNYVSDVVAGTGVTVTHTPGEGSSATIAIGQAVETTSEVTVAGLKTTSAIELLTISATAATGTINLDMANGTTYYTSNSTANWTVNLRWNSGTSLNTKLAIGEMATTCFLVTNGIAYYATAHQIAGGAVTPKWQGGSAPTAGNANSIDMYTYTVVKTAANTFSLFAALTRFA